MKTVKILLTGIILLSGGGLLYLFLSFPLAEINFNQSSVAIDLHGIYFTEVSSQQKVYRLGANGERLPLTTKVRREPFVIVAEEKSGCSFLLKKIRFTFCGPGEIYYQPQTTEISLRRGNLYWEKLGREAEFELQLKDEKTILQIAERGRCLIGESGIFVWNYQGDGKLIAENGETVIKQNQLVILIGAGRPRVVEVFPAPELLSAVSQEIVVRDRKDAFVLLKWKALNGARRYLLKIFTSPLRNEELQAIEIEGNSYTLDLARFLSYESIYWQVTALIDSLKAEPVKVESVLSELAKIKIRGGLLQTSTQMKSDKGVNFNLSMLSVNGNMVLVRGTTDTQNILYINDQEVYVDSEGNFLHSLSFNSIGLKEIIFRVVTPAGKEYSEKRTVTILDEFSE